MDTNIGKILPSSSREMRNRAEKQRRDKFNSYISEMGSLVSVVSTAPRKLDKTSTLRLCANFIRIHQNVDVRDNPIGRYNSGAFQACRQFLETLDAFMMVVSCSGKIIYVSDRVEKILGHSQADMMGLAVSNFVHRADHDMIQKKLDDYMASVSGLAGSAADVPEYCIFETRMAERQLSRGEATVYGRVRFSGKFRGPRRRPTLDSKTGNERGGQNGTSEPMLVAIVEQLHPQSLLPALTIIESMKNEYLTKHLPDGRIIQTDHRISLIAGYFMEEVMGFSAYNYICEEDAEFAGQCQKLMLTSGAGGVTTYRLRTRTGKLIFLRSRGIIEFDSNKEITGFVCVNEMISDEEGKKEIEAMKNLQAIMSSMDIDGLSALASASANNLKCIKPGTSQLQLCDIQRETTPNGCIVEPMDSESTSPMPFSPADCLSPSTFSTLPPSPDAAAVATVATPSPASPPNVSSPIEIQIPFPWCPAPATTNMTKATTNSNEMCNSIAMLRVDQKPRSSQVSPWKSSNGLRLNVKSNGLSNGILSAFTNGLSNTLTNGLPNGLVPLDGVGLEELEDGFELLNTPISVLNPTSSDYGNQKLTTSTKSNNCGNNSVGGCSSGIMVDGEDCSDSGSERGSFFKSYQPMVLSGMLKDWDRKSQVNGFAHSPVHDSQTDGSVRQQAADIIQQPRYFKDEPGMNTATNSA